MTWCETYLNCSQVSKLSLVYLHTRVGHGFIPQHYLIYQYLCSPSFSMFSTLSYTIMTMKVRTILKSGSSWLEQTWINPSLNVVVFSWHDDIIELILRNAVKLPSRLCWCQWSEWKPSAESLLDHCRWSVSLSTPFLVCESGGYANTKNSCEQPVAAQILLIGQNNKLDQEHIEL